ncbi:Calx-beta domain-containing protein [Thalassotalea nanhaiensis]|uniref:Calx-beta domain-containing protein n=1 Tax=Thalassotalea nanhaiensis TaxID=3065648 RepID=A0ABY9TGF3_9GAMM|nr:Calx-beta domain-containing protein [Colwelliaceae bacterium SQ345]
MKYTNLTAVALSVLLAYQPNIVLAETEQSDDIISPAFEYSDLGHSEVDNFSSFQGDMQSPLEQAEGEQTENTTAAFELLDLTGQFFTDHVAQGAGSLTFSVDDVAFEFNTRIEYHYGLLHLYGENSNGDWLRLIKGSANSWFGDVTNGHESFTVMATAELGGSAWFNSAFLHPKKGEILIEGELPTIATKDNSTVLDVGYAHTITLEGRYKRLGTRASILYFHYQMQDILDNSGSGYYLNPLFIERQDGRFFEDESKVKDTYLANGFSWMYGDLDGAETMREYIKDFGADYTSMLVNSSVSWLCGTARNEFTIDDIGEKVHFIDEEDRDDVVYGSLVSGVRHQCRNLSISRWFFAHNFVRPTRSNYENNLMLPANRRTDYGGVTDYAYASKCGGHATLFNVRYDANDVETLPLPLVSSPDISYKGDVCGDEKNNNRRALLEMLPSIADNANAPVATADVKFKSVVYITSEANNGIVTLIREGDLTEQASVEVAIITKGDVNSAVEKVDFIPEFKRAEFAPGESEAIVEIRIKDNDVYRESAIIDLSLNFPKRLNVVGTTTAQLIIQDNDSAKPGTFNFAQSAVIVDESAGVAEIKLLRSGDFEGSQMIKYSLIDGSAKSESDFEGTDGHVVFAEGETEKVISVTLISDNYPNLTDRTFSIQLDTEVSGDVQTVQVTIGDDDQATGVVAVATESLDVDHNASNISIKLTRDDASKGEILVNYKTVDGTAIAGTHYVATNASVMFAAGETEKTITVKKIRVADASEALNFTVELSSNKLSGAKVVSVNLLPAVEREEESTGGSLGFLALLLMAYTGYRRKYR